MQLKMVVLPAPLGPMRPTISNSSTCRVTSVRACRPPKRMDTSVASSTGAPTGGRAPSPPAVSRARSRTLMSAPSRSRHPAPVGQLEALTSQPATDRRGDGPQAVGLEDQGEDGQHRAEGLDVVAGVDLDGVKADGPRQVGQVLAPEHVQQREGDDAAPPPEAAHDGDDEVGEGDAR